MPAAVKAKTSTSTSVEKMREIISLLGSLGVSANDFDPLLIPLVNADKILRILDIVLLISLKSPECPDEVRDLTTTGKLFLNKLDDESLISVLGSQWLIYRKLPKGDRSSTFYSHILKLLSGRFSIQTSSNDSDNEIIDYLDNARPSWRYYYLTMHDQS